MVPTDAKIFRKAFVCKKLENSSWFQLSADFTKLRIKKERNTTKELAGVFYTNQNIVYAQIL